VSCRAAIGTRGATVIPGSPKRSPVAFDLQIEPAELFDHEIDE
jgi:hypothetical protein